MAISTFFLVASAATASAAPCDLRSDMGARELHEVLAQRAVELVGTAARSDAESRDRLEQLIDPDAAFGLGAGDVGRPMGSGAEGARAVVALMKADRYRYLGWDYMDGPVDACGEHEASIEFIASADRQVYPVTFHFHNGRVVEAKGWSRSFREGALP
ncbi:MAG: hypothetical protein VYD90_03880 [Pseudomonadota bacterium]|nr:hypothetical protein [Pseudomonadota bacterium]